MTNGSQEQLSQKKKKKEIELILEGGKVLFKRIGLGITSNFTEEISVGFFKP